MDTVLSQKFPFILDRNLAKANSTGNRVCTSCDIVVLGHNKKIMHGIGVKFQGSYPEMEICFFHPYFVQSATTIQQMTICLRRLQIIFEFTLPFFLFGFLVNEL